MSYIIHNNYKYKLEKRTKYVEKGKKIAKNDLKQSPNLEKIFQNMTKNDDNYPHITKYGMNDTKIELNFEILIKCYKTLHKMTEKVYKVWKSITTYD